MTAFFEGRFRSVTPWCLLGTAFTLCLAQPAAAKAPATIKASKNAKLNQTIAVDSKGRTVYVLKPETRRKLLCSSNDCLKAWPLVTVKSAKTTLVAGKGVKGKLAILKRGKKYQVTLGGKPLYRYAGDSGKGSASGEGISSFGGTWHVIAFGSTSSSPSTPVPYGY